MPLPPVLRKWINQWLEDEGSENVKYDTNLDGKVDQLKTILRSDLEYPTEDVNFTYLILIEKAKRFGTRSFGCSNHITIITDDNFTDKAIRGYAIGDKRYYGRWNDDDNFYTADTLCSASTADFRLAKRVAASETILAEEAADLSTNAIYHRALSISGSTLKGFRADGVADLPATPNMSATDTDLSSGGYGVLSGASNHEEYFGGNEIKTWLIAPLSPLPPARSIIETEIAVDVSGQSKPKLLQDLKEISSLTGLPNFLYQEAKRYETLKTKNFTDEEIESLIGYIPQYQVDLTSVSWGAFDHKPAHPTVLIIITADNPYQSGAISKQIENAKAKNLKTLSPPRDYAEAIQQYDSLKADFFEWLAGKDNFAFQILGHEDIESLAAADFYYGELIEHKIHYAQLKQMPDWEMERTLKMWKERLERVTAVPSERKELHVKKIEKVLKAGW